MNKREFLVKKGLAKPGRGRLSLAAHKALDKAVEKGTVFDEDVDVQFTFYPTALKRPR